MAFCLLMWYDTFNHMPYTKDFLREARRVGVAGMYQTRSAMERKIKSLEPEKRSQIKRFWQGAKMQPSQTRAVLEILKQQKILKPGASAFHILKKAKENVARAEAAKATEIKEERLARTAKFYAAQRRAEEEAKEGISPRSTIEEILKKNGPAPVSEQKKDGKQAPPPMLKEMMI